MITISIIIPVYQAEKYLRDCLDSVVQQNLNDYEVLCIDDGSTDHSADIIKQYTQKYPFVRYFYQTNRGVSAARNRGLQEASGKYVMFIDADDWIKKNTLKDLFQKAEQFHTDILVYGGQASPFFETSEWIRDGLFTKNKLYIKNSIRALFYETGSRPFVFNKLFSRKLLNGISFAEHITISEDQAFLFLVFPKAQRILYTNKNVYRYRIANDLSAMHQIAFDYTRLFQNHLKTVRYVSQKWGESGLLALEKEHFNGWLVSFLDIYHFLTEEQKQSFSEPLHTLSHELHFDIIHALNQNKTKEKNNIFFLKRYIQSIVRQIKKHGIKHGSKVVLLKIYDKYKNIKKE